MGYHFQVWVKRSLWLLAFSISLHFWVFLHLSDLFLCYSLSHGLYLFSVCMFPSPFFFCCLTILPHVYLSLSLILCFGKARSNGPLQRICRKLWRKYNIALDPFQNWILSITFVWSCKQVLPWINLSWHYGPNSLLGDLNAEATSFSEPGTWSKRLWDGLSLFP